ncbi:solute carrier family 52, riboflavin transporter, member 3-A [Monomorium pharaonis]|uniref:solute carrier family 52, riboflavin transporter, member 3-A n=1 Tax=Monomorium pharaonis TaxID=307658 RepID=UPI001746AFC8|nr:solute carrier family 52, riboflavin transporter, member 3-A [Monomorium pharaonis]XP_012535372.2 solute carrier family 52, riboflavin transporter, member 3-A [Monomorium pharaonis]XP_012535373.2 solute carrier family 52, riboflavin transporter, member 3-A [Monomorium pharaonis]XP_012535374.2 solute carrier family 52, riboflavin transporter, member 3-A [Monomorium pharaonis]XP_012535375.2 solute carrier family 52, riboflavin transporter, member 3-A [Monomorium pharaonis]XP_012535376.2 solut
MSKMLSQRLSNRRLLVDLLALMFGLGAWIGVNGVYVQLPLIVHVAPEGWSLPAHMVMLVQFANLGPILYTLYIKYSAWAYDKYIIYALLAAGACACIALAFLYDYTSIVFGKEHSTALLSLMFITALIGCTSSVLFMPYMRNYREIYLVSYLVGEGLSGFIPSAVALIQGVGGNPGCINVTKPGSSHLEFVPAESTPRFSSLIFFIFIGTLLCLSFLSFLCLNVLPIARGERVKLPSSMEMLPTDTTAPPSYKTNSGWKMPKYTYYYLLVMMAVVCFLSNGTLPSIQSYSCLPYGSIAYHLTVTLASIAGPLAMSLGFFVKTPEVKFLNILTAAILILSGFVLYLAAKSPYPPLQDSWVGEMLVVLVWITLCGLIGFVKMGITTLYRPDPGRGLYYTGVATQIGSLIGAITTFGLVNYAKVFQSYSPCAHLAEN